MAVEYLVETATVTDLRLLEAWTCWLPGRDVPCVVGGHRPLDAFRKGLLRVVAAYDAGERVGISLVASPAHAEGVDSWQLRVSGAVPGGECLMWVGMAICPSRRQSGIAAELIRRTLDMAATTGYPFIAAVFPIQDPRASALLLRSGFIKVDADDCDPAARQYCVYVCSTPTLSSDDVRVELAC
jgi:GNAT superfamily N-acetyltransferase